MEVRTIQSELIKPSPFNPRRELPNIDELAANIKVHGVLEPLLVMELSDGRFEIIDGHRRLAAAKTVGLESVPCIARKDLTDEQVWEIQLIKALQRADLHPYDEAAHIVRLLEVNNGDFAAVAAKMGKPERYVRRRAILNKLVGEAATLFMDGKMPLEAAFILARTTADQQKSLLKMRKRHSDWEFLQWAISGMYHELGKVPWKVDDADLYPSAGPCSTCPKQSRAQSMLFEELKSATTCLDSICFEEKMSRHIKQIKKAEPKAIEVAGEWTTPPKGVLPQDKFRIVDKKSEKCEHTKPAIIATSSDRGKQINICTDPKCKIHTGRSQYQRPEKTDKEKAERKKQLREEKIKKVSALYLYNKILNSGVGTLESLRLIVERLWQRTPHEDKVGICNRLGIEAKKNSYGGKDYDSEIYDILGKLKDEKELRRYCLIFALAPLFNKYTADSTMSELAEQFKIDLKEIRKLAAAGVDETRDRKGILVSPKSKPKRQRSKVKKEARV